MVEVTVIVEGVTEEAFVKQLMAPALRPLQIFIKPVMLNTSKDAKGGAVSFDRLKINVRNISRQYPRAVVTTLLDLYGLPIHAELKSHMQPFRHSTSKMQHGIGTTLLWHIQVQILINNFLQQAKHVDEVALACAIGPNQHIELPQREVFKGTDRFVAFDSQ